MPNQGNNHLEIDKLKREIARLEHMFSKLTMENYLLKKEKEYIARQKEDGSSIVTGNYSTPQKRDAD